MEDVQALEARLIAVARDAFILHGYGAVSINAVAKSARVSKNTLYARFPSKADLFQAIVSQQVASVDADLPSSTEGRSQALDARLKNYVNVALAKSLTREILQINRLIVSESHRFDELADSAATRFRIGVQHVAAIIEECAERDRVPCRNPWAAAELFLCSINGWYNQIVIANRVVSEKERIAWVDEATRLFVAGRAGW